MSPLARLAVVLAVLIAMVIAGASMFGHSQSVAASPIAPAPAPALQLAAAPGTDPSVPQASEVFSRQEPATEEACPTF